MITYGIRINNRWFKEYVYLNESNKDRYGGNTALGTRLDEGDIVDIVTTELPERTEVVRSIAGTVGILLSIEKLEGKVIEVIPLM